VVWRVGEGAAVLGLHRAFFALFRGGVPLVSQIDDGFMPLEVCLSQMPEQLSQGNRTWSFRYLPFYRDGELEGC